MSSKIGFVQFVTKAINCNSNNYSCDMYLSNSKFINIFNDCSKERLGSAFFELTSFQLGVEFGRNKQDVENLTELLCNEYL